MQTHLQSLIFRVENERRDGRDVEGRERNFVNKKMCWERNNASQCIGKHCSFPKEYKILGKLLFRGFCDFFEISPKI